MVLAKLEKVDLREVWQHEAIHFTNWLAKPENLELLSDEIGIGINLIQTEANVGAFNVDILAEEEGTGKKIVIENQLESTNHDHLGKIITYASGFDAETIIWIVKTVRDEHKQAVDWLNEHTDSGVNIFAIEMEVWKIGNSPFAPKFQVIAKPNDWAKTIKKSSPQEGISDTKVLQLEFWSNFKEFVGNKNKNFKLRKAHPQHWYDISVGSSLAHIGLTINSQQNQLGCELYIHDSKSLYNHLMADKMEIEQIITEHIEWMELPAKKASRIKVITDFHFNHKDNWPDSYEWLLQEMNNFQAAFRERIASFKG